MTKLYNANDGLTGRDGGPYLDQVEARHAEDRRAEVEGRKPNYDTMPLGPGVVYVTAAQLLASESVNNLPSQFDKAADAKEKAIAALVEDSDVKLEVAFDAPDVPDDDGKTADERQEFTDKALAPKKTAATKKTAVTPAKKSADTKKTASAPTVSTSTSTSTSTSSPSK